MTHVKIPEIKPEISYIGDGVLKQFTYPFPIFKDSDVNVYFNNVLQNGDYTVSGEKNTDGGIVAFLQPPSLNTVVTIKRNLPLQRATDFQETGRYSATALNDEFDYLTACVQQVNNKSDRGISFPTMESGFVNSLPGKDIRANKFLSFDVNGNPTVTELSGDESAVVERFLSDGASAVERTLVDKNKDIVSVKDFGANGGGISDDTNAIQSALAESSNVFFPPGIYNISSTLEIQSNHYIYGVGNNSVIKALNNSFDVMHVTGQDAIVKDIKIINGDTGIRLFGKNSPCVQNNFENIIIESAEMGIVLDGYMDTNKPCYWNNFNNILVSKPLTHGVLLTLTGAGDTPNANRFSKLRVYSHGEQTQGYGIYVQNGRYFNSFTDVEVNVYEGAHACVQLDNAKETQFINLYTETVGTVENIVLGEDSADTSIINHLSMSAGSAIYDKSGNGNYTAINAGWPEKHKLTRTKCDDFKAKLMRYDVKYIDEQSAYTLNVDLSTSFYLVSSYNGQVDVVLPKASVDNDGVEITIKKSDLSKNAIVITEENGSGPDTREIKLSARFDFVTVVSNGANWWIKSANIFPRGDQYYDGEAKVIPNMSSPLCLVSAYHGNVEVELPPADNINSIGQTLIIKKTDPSTNKVTVKENGGNGPDNQWQILENMYDKITVMSNGAAWHVI